MNDQFRKLVPAIIALSVMAIVPGCVHRRATIRTEPPGALISVGDREIGHSPASFDFTWYGTEEVTIRRDGYEMESHYIKLRRPWYQIPPLDLITDNLLPGRVQDRQEFNFQLRPRVVVPGTELLERGNALRSEAEIGQ